MYVILFQCEARQGFPLILVLPVTTLSLHLRGMTASRVRQCFLTRKGSISPGWMGHGKFMAYWPLAVFRSSY